MLNNNKLVFSVIFVLNFCFLMSLKLIFSINIDVFPYDRRLATSPQMKVFLILMILTGQFIIVLRLIKLKISRNLANYSFPPQYVRLGMILLHTQHHPNCSCYSDHEIILNNHKICSGCYGSSFGMVLGIIALVSVFVIKLPFEFYFYSGILLIQLALVKFLFASYTRFFLNAFFPLGVNLLLVSSFIKSNILIYALIFIPLLFLELGLRLFIADIDNTVEVCPEGLRH